MGWDPVAKWSFQVTRQSGHLGRYGTGTLANLSGQVALIPIDAYRPLDLLVPTSAFLCGVYRKGDKAGRYAGDLPDV